MYRSHEKFTLICQNPNCPRPNGEFQVTRSGLTQVYCSMACTQPGIAAAHELYRQLYPEMTGEVFAVVARKFTKVPPALQAAARRVLCGGEAQAKVARVTGLHQPSISRVVNKYRHAVDNLTKEKP